MIVGQIEQLHRMVRRAGKGSRAAVVVEATRIVGKAIVPYLKAERLRRTVPGGGAEREAGFRHAIPTARIREGRLKEDRKSCDIDRVEGRKRSVSHGSTIRFFDTDVTGRDVASPRVFPCCNPCAARPRRTIPDPGGLAPARSAFAIWLTVPVPVAVGPAWLGHRERRIPVSKTCARYWCRRGVRRRCGGARPRCSQCIRTRPNCRRSAGTCRGGCSSAAHRRGRRYGDPPGGKGAFRHAEFCLGRPRASRTPLTKA